MGTKDLTVKEGALATSMVADFAPLSVKEARKVLGPEYKDKSDESIAELIVELTIVARTYIRGVLKSPLSMYN